MISMPQHGNHEPLTCSILRDDVIFESEIRYRRAAVAFRRSGYLHSIRTNLKCVHPFIFQTTEEMSSHHRDVYIFHSIHIHKKN